MNIKDKSALRECTSCQMCAAVCSHNAININLNEDGFYRPYVNADKCTDCGLCTKICYKYDVNIKNTSVDEFDKIEVHSAQYISEALLEKVSSGGVADYMSFANYFVLTSDKEGLSLTLLEAMSMGVIPVCTPAGGIKDVIRNGENGFMNKEVSDEGFYDSVKEALSGEYKISKDKIIREFNEKYSMSVCARKYAQLYGISL